MNPITHLLASWSLGEASRLEARDRSLITWIGIAPDLDALGIIPDMAARRFWPYRSDALWPLSPRASPRPLRRDSAFRCGGKPRAPVGLRSSSGAWRPSIFISCATSPVRAVQRSTTSGPCPTSVPFSEALTFSWSGQWPLNAWQNVAATASLIIFALIRTATAGHSPLSLISARAHKAFTATVQARWRQLRKHAEPQIKT